MVYSSNKPLLKSVIFLFETISLFRDLSVSLQSNNEYITEPNDDNGYRNTGFRGNRTA